MPSPLFPLPAEPMAPISSPSLPEGGAWTYQLKWDGVRILAAAREDGQIQLWSRKMLLKNAVYPEVERLLRTRLEKLGSCVLDGEVVYWDGSRPNFQKVLQRERSVRSAAPAAGSRSARPDEDAGAASLGPSRSSSGESGLACEVSDAAPRQAAAPAGASAARAPSAALPADIHAAPGLMYVLFDLIRDNDRDLRPMPFAERHAMLMDKINPVRSERIFVTECYADGEALWKWVEQRRWEGVVSKKLDSPYREGKRHNDWLKTKTKVMIDVDLVGIKLRDGRAASLIMSLEGCYLGSVSIGLDGAMLRTLDDAVRQIAASGRSWPMPFAQLPADLKKETLFWLPVPLRGRVTGLEITSAGQLRHPKLVSFGMPGTEAKR
ncbi:hypothetical protein ACFSL6_19350 [Paenibacillus thailandensis]|uniref:ATP-dependent DNA ligase family profile domain-containing protein n=1 Tax=Paenibacillus thailandensis TaxID=393250 RepID=A0ABW5QT27_9BACL